MESLANCWFKTNETIQILLIQENNPLHFTSDHITQPHRWLFSNHSTSSRVSFLTYTATIVLDTVFASFFSMKVFFKHWVLFFIVCPGVFCVMKPWLRFFTSMPFCSCVIFWHIVPTNDFHKLINKVLASARTFVFFLATESNGSTF